MNSYTLSPAAEQDLDFIWAYIAIDSPRAATRFVDRILEKCELLADHPLAGQARDEFLPSLRSFPIGKYLIFYRPLKQGIEVVRVLHGTRRLEDLF